MSILPLWIPATLGKQVALLGDFKGAAQTYPQGSVGRLMGIMVDDDKHTHHYAIVALDSDDESYLENFEFGELRPLTDKVQMSLNMEEGLMSF